MSGELAPRREFTEPLRDWFVAELTDAETLRDTTHGPVTPVHEPMEFGEPDPPRRGVRILLNAAVVFGLLTGALFLLVRDDDRGDVGSSTSAVVDDPTSGFRDVCDRFASGPDRLPLGAGPAEIMTAVDDLRVRLDEARSGIEDLAARSGVDATNQLRLIDEAVARTDLLGDLADGARNEIDEAVTNLDLLLVAWGQAMDELAGEGCSSPPTLRELG